MTDERRDPERDELISAAIDGELAPGERVPDGAETRQAELEAVRNLLAESPQGPGESERDAMLALAVSELPPVRDELAVRRARRARRAGPILAAAAALVAVLGIAGLISAGLGSSDRDDTASVSLTDAPGDAGGETADELDDGADFDPSTIQSAESEAPTSGDAPDEDSASPQPPTAAAEAFQDEDRVILDPTSSLIAGLQVEARVRSVYDSQLNAAGRCPAAVDHPVDQQIDVVYGIVAATALLDVEDDAIVEVTIVSDATCQVLATEAG